MCLLSMRVWVKSMALSNFTSSWKQARNLIDLEPGNQLITLPIVVEFLPHYRQYSKVIHYNTLLGILSVLQ